MSRHLFIYPPLLREFCSFYVKPTCKRVKFGMSWLLLLRIRNFNQVVGEDAFEQCRSLLALQQAAERLTLKRFVPALATNTYILLLFTAGPNSVKVLCDSVLTKAFEEETESDIIYFTFCKSLFTLISCEFAFPLLIFGHAQKAV